MIVSEKWVLISAVFVRMMRNASLACLAIMHGKKTDRRQNGKSGQRKPPVHVDQHDGDAAQQKHILEYEGNDGCEHFLHVLNIVCGSGNQAGHGILVKIAYRHVLYMGKELHSKIMHDFLAGIFHDHLLGKVENEIQNNDAQKDEGNPGNSG